MNSNSFNKDDQIILGEQQLRHFGKFLNGHNRLLYSLLHTEKKEKPHTDHRDNNLINESQLNLINLQCDVTDVENILPFQLLESDNKILNKIIAVFTSLCNEINLLKIDANKYHLNLLYYDEDITENDEIFNIFSIEKITNILGFLAEIKHFLQRCTDVLGLTLQQLGALFDEDQCLTNIKNSIHFQAIFEYIGDILIIYLIFDEILSNGRLTKFWNLYKKQIQSIRFNMEQFKDYNQIDINGLHGILLDLDVVFSGKLLQHLLEKCSSTMEITSPKATHTLADLMNQYLKNDLSEIVKYQNDLSELDETIEIVRININTIFYHNVFGNVDQKYLKTLFDINNKYCGITLIGNLLWYPEKLIKKHAVTLLKGNEKYFQDAQKIRQNSLSNKTINFIKDTQLYCTKVIMWVMEMNISLKTRKTDLNLDQLRERSTLFMQGLQYAGEISHLIKSITNLHVLLKIPMQKAYLASICKLIEFLQLISGTFKGHLNIIIYTNNCIIQHYEYQALFVIENTKKKLMHDSSYNEKSLDMLSALQIAESCLFGPATPTRILIIRLVLNALDITSSADYIKKLEKILKRLKIFTELQMNLDKLCDISFLYWHQTLFKIYLKYILEKNMDYHKLSYMLCSANNCSNKIRNINSLQINGFEFDEMIKNDFKLEFIYKLCGIVETNLRLDFHSNFNIDLENPFNKSNLDVRQLITLKPMPFAEKYLIVKDHIEHYLSNMYYNLTTISLHDWKTYGEMRRLAYNKLELVTIDDHLPTQTLEQGCDVLEIMRNIQTFVSRYIYNLNNQIFIERSSNNKHLNTINIRHIANSLRTHGTGIINTTVNFTYQFLRKKIYILSQFLYDEQIKSRLMKDFKYYKDNKEALYQIYSYQRADNFNKGIRKLGISSTGESYLDYFRLVISHIGNAMGYIRMMRSGCIHTCSNASVYLPILNEDLLFTQLVKKDQLSELVYESAKYLENDIKNVSKKYAGTEYFKLLVEAFKPFSNNPKNIHLKNFYLIVPALTINFVEYILMAKDKMSKKNKQDALFTDDGFVMGLAYILKLLDQINDFNSLHWFQSIRQKAQIDREKVNEQRKMLANNADVKLQQTLALTEKRINTFQQEYDLLYYNLSSAKIFFQ